MLVCVWKRLPVYNLHAFYDLPSQYDNFDLSLAFQTSSRRRSPTSRFCFNTRRMSRDLTAIDFSLSLTFNLSARSGKGGHESVYAGNDLCCFIGFCLFHLSSRFDSLFAFCATPFFSLCR